MPDIDLAKQALRIAIVDDHPSVREGLALRVSIEPDLEVCWEAADLPDALERFKNNPPDVAVIDISLKTGTGIDLIKRVRDDHPEVRILVCSMYPDSLYAERVLRAGAMGYINKENSTGKIVEAIREIVQDRVYLSPEVSERILKANVGGTNKGALDPVKTLSDRELETFSMIGYGMGTHEIAGKMFLSPKTVETYRKRVKEKLGLSDLDLLKREAVRWVLENARD